MIFARWTWQPFIIFIVAVWKRHRRRQMLQSRDNVLVV
jgi:hypothetical protein